MNLQAMGASTQKDDLLRAIGTGFDVNSTDAYVAYSLYHSPVGKSVDKEA